MIDTQTIRKFFQRLNHEKYGLTELVALNKNSGNLVATGFFDDEEKFVSSCYGYSRGCNLYAGRNPRPPGVAQNLDVMDVVRKKRARDRDIKHITAISLDIDPVREKGLASTEEQHDAAIRFALDLQWDFGGDVDDSGNGVYLWIPFVTPIEVTSENFERIKGQCKNWHEALKNKYSPVKYGLRIDGCFDFSRIKRVIGTFNHKAQRSSIFIRQEGSSDRVRGEILSTEIVERPGSRKARLAPISPVPDLPERFRSLLAWDILTRDLWQHPDRGNDKSKHDWMLGLSCVEAGITEPGELAAILMKNPHGKYQRDGREDYVQTTVEKLVAVEENAEIIQESPR